MYIRTDLAREKSEASWRFPVLPNFHESLIRTCVFNIYKFHLKKSVKYLLVHIMVGCTPYLMNSAGYIQF
jgi:hypothetical protein